MPYDFFKFQKWKQKNSIIVDEFFIVFALKKLR